MNLPDGLVDAVIRTCEAHPSEVVRLPDWCYDKNGLAQVTVDGLRVVAHRFFYEKIRGPLDPRCTMKNISGDPLNVNPLLFLVSPTPGRGPSLTCPNNHVYAEVGELPIETYPRARCLACWRKAHPLVEDRKPNAGDINRQKTHCPRGHEYTKQNTMRRPSDKGARRCRICEQLRQQARTEEQRKGWA